MIWPEISIIEDVDTEVKKHLENGTYFQEEMEICVDGNIVGNVYTNSESTVLIIYEDGATSENNS